MISLIQRFGRDILVTRNDSEVVFIDGYAQKKSSDLTLTVRASVQPMSPEDLEMLPEGSDTKEAIKLYTIEKLLTRQGNPPVRGDFFVLNNNKYEVVSTEDHTSHSSMNIFYYKCVGIKVSYDA